VNTTPTTDDTTVSPRLPRNVKLLGWASLLNDVASEMIVPLLPTFLISVLGGSPFKLGVIEGAADSASSLVKLWSGSRSDRGGRRKPFVVFGYALAAIARPFSGVVTAAWQLFGVRIADRAGKGIRTSPRDALIADSTEPAIRGRAFGFHRGMDHLGAAVGPLLAAAVLWFWSDPQQEVPETVLRGIFVLTLVPGALVVMLLVFGLREPAIKPRPTVALEGTAPAGAAVERPPQLGATAGRGFAGATAGRGFMGLTLAPFDCRFRLYLLALVVFTLGNSSDLFLLMWAGKVGVATWLLPILWCAFHVAKSGGNMLAGNAVDRVGPRPMILAGWLLYAGIYLAFALASAVWHVWALFIAYAVYYAMTEPAEKTLVASLVGQEHRGLAYGWYNCAVGIATLPASLIFGALYQTAGPLVAFGSGAGLALVAAILLAASR
jgi:MFS family permease